MRTARRSTRSTRSCSAARRPPYWGPAHRRAVDIAIETRDHEGVLARIEAIKTTDPIPPSAAGERAYLRGRAVYDKGKYADAEGELVTISKKSRLYSSAVYLRGVIRARRGEYKDSAEAMCEIAGTPDSDKLTFVVDDRYFTVKDLARLGLGRLAHEQGEYDDAYYHYFQIPEDSPYLPDALFEASWSMYQKRELATSRDLVKEFLKEFPTSPLWPEASLLAGYVELADCKFTESQKWYDDLVAKLQPIVDTMDKVRKDPGPQRTLLFARPSRAIARSSRPASSAAKPGTAKTATLDEVLALLRLDPKFLRLNDAVTGVHELANSAPHVVRQWQNLGTQVNETKVGAVSGQRSLEQEQLADANALVEDLRRLDSRRSHEQRLELVRARRDGTMLAAGTTPTRSKRLDELAKKVADRDRATPCRRRQGGRRRREAAAPAIRPMIQADIDEARRLDKASHALAEKLAAAGDKLAQPRSTGSTTTRARSSTRPSSARSTRSSARSASSTSRSRTSPPAGSPRS